MSMAPKMVFFEDLCVKSYQGHDSSVEGYAVELRQTVVDFVEQRRTGFLDMKGCVIASIFQLRIVDAVVISVSLEHLKG